MILVKNNIKENFSLLFGKENMQTPLLSIVVPVYNVQHYLSRCIESIIAQPFSNYECILIDDGSTDNSGVICDSYAEKDLRFKVIHKKNEGVAIARKTGFYLSTGAYIHFVDSDDWIQTDIYSSIFSIPEYFKYDEFIFGYSRIDENNRVLFKKIPEVNLQKKDLLNNQYELSFLLWNKIINRKILLNCDFSKTDRLTFSEDSYISFCSLVYAHSTYIHPKSLYNYFYRSNSVTRAMSVRNHEDEIKASMLIEEFCKQHDLPYNFPILNKKKFNSKLFLLEPDFSLTMKDVYLKYKKWNSLFPEIDVHRFMQDKSFFMHICVFLVSHHLYISGCIFFKLMKTKFFLLKINKGGYNTKI